MLSETFLHLPGIGEVKERRLWEAGATTWEDAAGHRHGVIGGLTAASRELLRECLEDAGKGRFNRTAAALPGGEHWRALCTGTPSGNRPLRWLALDIETTGLSAYDNRTTVVGVCGHATGFEPVALVASDGDFPGRLPEYLAGSDVLITFNGRSFDVPFLARDLAREFLTFPPFHVDLMLVLRRLGERGGLKKIQQRLCTRRDKGLQEVDGFMAVKLWQEHLADTRGARKTIVRYCLEDVVVLFDLARLAYDRAAAELDRTWRCWNPPTVSLEHLEYDGRLVQRLLRKPFRYY